jgi:hypothetical protein
LSSMRFSIRSSIGNLLVADHLGTAGGKYATFLLHI